jgi:hypothetical protein
MNEITIKKELQPIANEALELKVKSHGDLLVAENLLTKLNQISDRIEEEKQKVLGPLNKARMAEINRWKPVIGYYESAIAHVRGQMTNYQTKQIALEKAKEQKIVSQMESGKIDTDKAVSKLEDIDRTEKRVGNTVFVEKKNFEVMDVTMLPKEYILPNEVAIRKAMLEGKELPGVRYYTEQIPRNKH